MVVGARQSFQFFTQNSWFLENNRTLSKFSYGIFHYLINHYLKKSIHKTQFCINHASHLKQQRFKSHVKSASESGPTF